MPIFDTLSRYKDRIVETAMPMIHGELGRAKTKNLLLKMDMAERPTIDELLSEFPDIALPLVPHTHEDLREMRRECSVLNRCIIALRQEIFRRGFDEPQPNFKFKCKKCSEEYDALPENKACACGGELREPSKKQYKRAKALAERKINKNGQKLIDLYQHCEDDVNTYDDEWIIARQVYSQLDSGKIIETEVKEYVRGTPKYMRWVTDDRNYIGGKWSVCLAHRGKPLDYKDGKPIRCPICGKKTFNVIAVGLKKSEGEADSYYIDGEVFHRSKYNPSGLYGYSPISSLWRKAITLVYMETYIEESYRKKRTPNGILAVNTKNYASLQAWWKEQTLALKKDPNHIPVAAIENDTGMGKVEFVKFMDSIKEMEYGEVRQEFKTEIGALMGVMPMFQGDLSTGGGLNNEGLQVTVTGRAAELGQCGYNDYFTPEILRLEGITDWSIPLLPSEEVDEMADLQRRGQEIMNAQAMATLGFDVSMKEDGEFDFNKVESSIPQPESPFGEAGPEMPGLDLTPSPTTLDLKGATEIDFDDPIHKILKTLAPSDFPLEVEIEDDNS